MNEFDQFMKQELKVKYYARYTDDFVVVADNVEYLQEILKPISIFLDEKLRLSLHPDKVSIRSLHNGVDYLGYVVLPHYKLLRTKTKRRIYKGLRKRAVDYSDEVVSETSVSQALQSYLGALSHADAHSVSEDLKNLYWFLMKN